uniref:Uncharacterized protein n=1 Tax=Euplotes harpa TaxID=151035 RepID=A0A7S3JJB4_9SPIT|mmetsp:Transcript_39758/g.45637  ORF Transcript_39758/g.45637 Transcript_39758/m.45637 type:complete len:197 (+) Transcript_39758:2-592(+)
MSRGQNDGGQEQSSSIYEKFKENTHKIFNEDIAMVSQVNRSHVGDIEKGHQNLASGHSLKPKHSRNDKKRQEYRNLSQINVKSMNPYMDKGEEVDLLSGSSKQPSEVFHNSMKKKKKIAQGGKKTLNPPIKLDKNLKSIEDRILNKMKAKKETINVLPKMPSIERNHSPPISYDVGRFSAMKHGQDNSHQTMTNML